MKKFYFIFFVSVLAVCFVTSCAGDFPKFEKSGEKYGRATAPNPKEIVFIHGMFVTPKCWQLWQEKFSALGYKVSAPAWPLHDLSVDEIRKSERQEALGKLEFSEVLEYYRKIIKEKAAKPILIGHSMGGLIAQILLIENLAESAVVLDSAPPNGVIALSWSFLKSNWGAISPFADKDQPIQFSFEDFSYAFVNRQPPELHKKIYDEFYVPESRRVGKAPTTEVTKINSSQARGPLLIVAGGNDNIIPPGLNYKNFKYYNETPAYTEFKVFDGRDHWILAGENWQEVADYTHAWIEGRFKR